MIIFILCLVSLLLYCPEADAISIPNGEKAPVFTLGSAEGKPVSLSGYKGKAVVLIYWRTNHERSLRALQESNDVLKKFTGEKVQMVSVVAGNDDRKNASNVLNRNDISYPLLVDEDRQLFSDYGVRVYPTTMIIDRKGVLVYHIPGHPLTYKKQLEGYVRNAIGEIEGTELENAVSPHLQSEDRESSEASRLYSLAMTFTESGLHDMAVKTAKKSIEVKPEMLKSHILLGFLYLEMKEADQAYDAFRKALELDSNSNDAKTGLGGALILRDDVDEAIKVLDSAAVANPYPQMTYYELGKAYEKKVRKTNL